jgi:DNA topoisomerase-1
VLRDFWTDFSLAIDGTKELRTTQVLDSLNDLLGPHIFPAKEDGSNPRACPSCGTGMVSLKLGKFGAFIGCSNYPECKYTRTLSDRGDAAKLAEGERPGVKILGEDPATGQEITLRDGRFGTYVQEGEGDKPKRSSLPANLKPEDVTLAIALALLSLPREVAKHPESGEPILAGIGRYGSYVQHKKTYANLDKGENVLDIGANRAIDLIITKEAGGGGRFGGTGGEIRALGDHPQGGAIALKAGRFGPYLAWGKVNANVPKGADISGMTLEQAVVLVDARAAGAPSDGRLLGEHPDGGPIAARPGRFGPYVSWNKVFATLPKSTTLETVSLEEAIRLIEDKIASGATPGKKKAPAKKAPAKKAAAAKKPAAKAKAPAAKAKPEIVESDEAPFEGGAPVKKTAAKKAAAKK